jgi:hypothetical protein
MNHFYKTSLLVLAMLTTHNAVALDDEGVIASSALVNYEHTQEAYPPVLFVTNIEDKAFMDTLTGFGAFQNLDEKAVGLPIGLRILKGHRTKQDGTQFTSLMLSASTLGLIPVVSNTEFKVKYDVYVQGESIASFEYMMDSTDVDNMWTSAYNDRETKPSETQFLQDTLPQFLKELKEHKEAQEVFAEYREFFK